MTYFAVSSAFALDVLWLVFKRGAEPMAYAGHHLLGMFLLIAFSPFFRLAHLGSGLFGLLLLFFALQSAWENHSRRSGRLALPCA